MNRVLLRKVRREIWERKGSILALVLVVMVGVGSFVAMAAVYRDLDKARAEYYRDYRLADFVVDLKRAPEWTMDAVEDLPNVKDVRGRISLGVLVDLPHTNTPVSGIALSLPSERRPILNDVLLRQGMWFGEQNRQQVILNESFAKANGLKPGDSIKVLLPDKQHTLLVVGTVLSPEFVYLIPQGGGIAPDPARFAVMYLSRDLLEESGDLEGSYNQLVGTVYNHDETEIENSLELISDKLDPYGVITAQAMSEQASVKFLADELRGLRISARIMPGIFLGVAALVLNILMSRMVSQQRSVIGTLKAIGYGKFAVTRHYLNFGLLIGITGGICGLVMGRFMESLLLVEYRKFYTLPEIQADFYTDIYLFGLGISILFSILGTIKGVWKAAGMDPAESMRPPPPERGGKIMLERISLLWDAFPFRWKMIFRAIFRNPFRSMVSIGAAVVSTAMILASLSTVDALNYLMWYEFDKIAHQDITISLRDPVGRGVSREVADLPFVSIVEPQLSITCDMSFGSVEKRTGVTAIPDNNTLYTPLDSSGNPITAPETGLILSKKLAEILNVKPGDVITLRPLIGERRKVQAPVVGWVDTYLGLSAYAGMDYLSGLIGENWAANAILGKMTAPRHPSELYRELMKRPEVVGIGERVRSLTRIQETFGETMGISISILVFFAGLIAFGSVLNTALVSLSERRREVGTLRVLGYTTGQAGMIFSGESLIVNIFGVMLGLVAGIGLAWFLSRAYSTEIYRFPFVVYPVKVVLTALIMLGFILVAQVTIFYAIRKQNWLEVLKVKE